MESGGQVEQIGGRRSTGRLLGGWAAYWIALPVVGLWTPVRRFLEVKERTPGGAALLIDHEGELRLRVLADNAPVWAAGMSFTELAVWVFGPPLLWWLIWLWWSARVKRHAPDAVGAPVDAPLLRQPNVPDQAGAARMPERSRPSVDGMR